jgi:hypothetical protein
VNNMLVLPIDTSRPLLVLAAPAPQFKDKEKQEALTDRGTGAALVDVAVSLSSDTGRPAGVAGVGASARGAEGSREGPSGQGDRADTDRG